MRRYILLLVATGVVPLLAVLAFVLLVDPYDIYGAPRIDGFNAEKPRINSRPHIYKLAQLDAINPRAVILGSSRADVGFDPAHPGLLRPAYNLGYGGHTWQDSLDLLQMLLAKPDSALRQVVLHVDAFNANAVLLRQPSLAESTTELIRSRGLLVSAETRGDAWATVQQQDRPAGRYVDGFNVAHPPHGTHADFLRQEGGVVTALLFVNGRCEPLPAGTAGKPLDVLGRLLQLAHAHRLDVRIVIGPSHARYWELAEMAGHGAAAEQWKRELVALNAQVAAGQGRAAFPLWDFSGYTRLTSEQAPLAPDQPATQWYYEASHFKRAAGNLVLDRVFGTHSVPGDWQDIGVLLDAGNLDAHIARQQADRMAWRAQNADDLVDLRAALAVARDKFGCAVPVEPDPITL